ncbi:MAG: hypothetical protein WBA13_13180 [Microcoleaceae cyanobacterium]
MADKIGVKVPFNHFIVGKAAFNHKAGIHTKAMINNTQTYESINPIDLGLTHSVLVNHKLIGSYTITHGASQLRLHLDSATIKVITQHIKALADKQNLSSEDVDKMLISYHQTVS